MAGKNPFLSAWLSGANMWASAARSFWAGEMQRQQPAMLNEMTKQMIRFCTDGWMVPGRRLGSRKDGPR